MFRERNVQNREVLKPRLCEQPDNSDFTNRIEKLETELEKSKHESARYKHEYQVVTKQMNINKETITSLETQIVDLKQIISKLTRNNGELLEIISEKINYEDKLSVLEEDRKLLTEQLQMEKSETVVLHQKLKDSQREVIKLKTMTAGLLKDLPEIQPSTKLKPMELGLGDDTRHVLGMKEDEDDSAYEDPRTDSILSARGPSKNGNMFHQLNVELSSDAEDGRRGHKDNMNTEIYNLSLKLNEVQIPKPRPYPEASLHLSLSSSESEHQVGAASDVSTLSEGKFLKGLEESIELNKTNMTTQSD